MMGESLVRHLGLMSAMEPFWRNFFDNLTTVQFDHRMACDHDFRARHCVLVQDKRKSDLPQQGPAERL